MLYENRQVLNKWATATISLVVAHVPSLYIPVSSYNVLFNTRVFSKVMVIISKI